MNRKQFLRSASLAAAGSLLVPTHLGATQHDEVKQVVKPPRLKIGDTLVLLATASYITEKQLEESVKNMETLGFRVKIPDDITGKNGLFSKSDAERAADVNNAFADSDVQGIMCIRGGYGTARILPLLDYQMIASHPKVVLGYSDVTALHYALYKEASLVSFHGPVATSTFNPYSVANMQATVMSDTLPAPFVNAADAEVPLTVITPGSASGFLVGGNLSVMVSLIGTRFDVPTSGALIYIEEIGEEPYRIDRMLTQMIQAGKFTNAAGVLCGVFRNCESKVNSDIDSRVTLTDILKDRLEPLGIPVLYGFSFGHIVNKVTLPFGISAEMNTEQGTLRLLEPAVV